MQTRPSTVYVRRCCVKRKTLRCAGLFAFVALILLCCGVSLIGSLLCSGATVIAVNVFVLK